MSRPQSSQADTNDEILTSLTLDSRAWIKHWLPEINENQIEMLVRYMKQLRNDEVERFADYMNDCDDPEEYEYCSNQYAYKRTRTIDAE